MNKTFSHRYVSEQADKLTDYEKQYVTFGDILEIAKDVADDITHLDEVRGKLEQCAVINEQRQTVSDIATGNY